MNQKFLKPYDPQATEDRIYELWEKSGFFNPDTLPERNQKGEPYSMVMPPPNVTGVLHLGHSMEHSLQDAIVRYKRMRGYRTLWIPGTDHAAIATQSKVEKDIQKKEGKSRYDLGRDELLSRVKKFAQESHDTIVSQTKKMGCSVDWSREAFTLDDKRNFAVRTAFKHMYDDGLIYRGYRVVNWDPKGQTTISDDEIVYETRKAKLYTFRYAKDFPIPISTTRPETKLGDTAVAVHPDDDRYKRYVGNEYNTVFAGEHIRVRIIADSSVDPAFGTGALGVTPAHSMIDWDMSQRHGLPLKQIIDEHGRMIVNNDVLKGKKTIEAREVIVAWLKAQNLLEKEEDIDQNVGTAERTGGVIEPLPKLQWFVAVNKPIIKNGVAVSLKEMMIKAVEHDGVEIMPNHFEKIYKNWITNLRDWCISRQIWYGHRIPVWYRNDEIYCDIDAPVGDGWIQDEDTLDTWFSSGLWTFSTLGWPDQTEDFKTYHPTTLIAPAYEILFFWVARMIMMSTYLIGQIPFKTVYLHGVVRDAQGRKFSKSLNNGIDPLDMIAQYGTDALRMALIIGIGPGNDVKFDSQKVKAYKMFTNKLWNIARFIISTAEGERFDREAGKAAFTAPKIEFDPNFSDWTPSDAVHMKKLTDLVTEITGEMEEYKFYLVGEKLYHYVWHEFADVILEESKPIISGTDKAAMISRIQFLLHAMRIFIKALHPFMPYVTEEIWGEVNGNKTLLIVEEWPK